MNDINVNQAAKFATADSSVVNASASLGEDDFLKLLAIQLQYQDPLEPMENTEFIAQLAQFSTLEGITSMGKSLLSMSSQIGSMNNLYTTSLIGKSVKVYGSEIELTEGQGAELEYLLRGDATNIEINIADSSGVRIRTIRVASQQAGSNNIQWDGKNESGLLSTPGDYTFSVSATDISGDEVIASTIMSARVKGIVYENSTPYLMLNDDMVSIDKVLEIWN